MTSRGRRRFGGRVTDLSLQAKVAGEGGAEVGLGRPSAWRQSFAISLPANVSWACLVNFMIAVARLVIPFLGLYFTVQLHYSEEQAALLVAAYGGGAVLSSLSGGILCDLLGRKPVLLMAAAADVMTCVALVWARNVVVVVLLLMVLGWCVNAPQTAINALISDMTEGATRREAFAVNTWGANVGFAIGPAAVGAWLGNDYSLMFFGQAVIVAAVFLVVARKIEETAPLRWQDHGQLSDFTLPRDALLYQFVTLNFVFTLMFLQFSFGLPLSLERLGYGQRFFALLMGVNGVFLAVLQLPIQRAARLYKPHHVLAVGSLVMAAADGITALSRSPLSYVTMMLFWTLAEALYVPTADYVAAYMSSEADRGRYQGVHKTTFYLAQLGAPLVAGVLLARAGVAALWLTCVALGVVAAAGLWSLGHRLERRRTLSDLVLAGAEVATY